MGEVYRARDTRLDRTVAIKILPAEFANDAKLKIRFEREAKAIAALDHPHICTLHDVGHENGIDFLVMEYCEGKTLAQRIAEGSLPVEQAVTYGIEIADALDRAHQRGIVHRDLKPSNIMLTKSGVKLLDFGLAKQQGDSSPEASTLKQVTEEGKILGTIQYMAPEVLGGKEADAHSDIFAFDLVLYEMLTGKAAFSGTSRASLIAAILEREPAPLSNVVPRALDRLVTACLAKQPEDRIQSAHDVALELRWLREAKQESRMSPVRRWAVAASVAVALIAVAGALGVITWSRRQSGTSVNTQRLDLRPPDGIRIVAIGPTSKLAISPDGQWGAFRGESDDPNRTGLYLRSTRELDARLIAISVGPLSSTPFFSPDSKWLGFFAEGAIQKMPVNGGEPQRICDVPRLRGASWGDDGSIVFSTGAGLLRVDSAGGQPEQLTVPAKGSVTSGRTFCRGERALSS